MPARRDAAPPAGCTRRALARRAGAERSPLVEVEDLAKTFDVSPPWLNRVVERKPRQFVQAVDDVGFTIARGKTLALVGESGCGKSTVARLLVGLYAPTRGTRRLRRRRRQRRRRAAGVVRRRMQMIFQDPYASLNPRWKVQRHRRRAAARARLRRGPSGADERRAAHRRARRRAAALGRPGRRRRREVPAPVLGRPAAAHLDRARARDRSPSSWSATSRPRRSTSRCRRRSSTS